GAGGAEVLQQHVAAPGQLVEQAQALVAAEVQGDAALVAVTGEEVGAERAGEGRAPGTGVVARAGPLDLDDLRPQVAEDLATERAGQDARGVQDAHVGERGLRVGRHRGFLGPGQVAGAILGRYSKGGPARCSPLPRGERGDRRFPGNVAMTPDPMTRTY